MKKKLKSGMPASQQIESELKRARYKSRYRSVLMSTIYALLIVAALAVLVATLWLPVLHIYGNSMAPTLENGQIVLAVKTSEPEERDIIAFYYNNKILVKRVIARSGSMVEIAEDGTVTVDGTVLEEPYIAEKAFGECNLEMPYQVPEGKVFVAGDNRAESVDSRNTTVGCVAEEQIIGRVILRVWPLESISGF